MNANQPAPKLLLVIPHLGGGGAERVIALLAQHLDSCRFEVHLVLLLENLPGALAIPKSVMVHQFHASRVRHALWKLLRLIWRERPDIVLSGIAHLNFVVLALRLILPLRTKLIVRQNTMPSLASAVGTRILYRVLYPLAALVICQSKAMADDLERNFWIARRKMAVLANPIKPLRVIEKADAKDGSPPRLLCVSRLSKEKGVDILLRAFVSVKQQFKSAQLTILGSGPEVESLRRLSRRLDLANSVEFAGYSDPEDFYSESTLFVSSSRYEGMPNSLLEAAAAGLPIVATPSSEGVTQLLGASPGTWTAKGVSANELAESLLEALHCLERLPVPSQRFRHSFIAPFEVTTAVRAYEQVLLGAERRGHR